MILVEGIFKEWDLIDLGLGLELIDLVDWIDVLILIKVLFG